MSYTVSDALMRRVTVDVLLIGLVAIDENSEQSR